MYLSFFLGLYDDLPVTNILRILETYLPSALFFKLKKYVTADPKTVRNHVSWKQFQEKLEKLHLESCSSELLKLFDKTIPSEDNVKTFHICNNQKNNGVTEPTHKNTTQMIYTFLTAIYQRNVLASLVKFIILKPLLHQLEISALMPQKKGIFYSIHQRVYEIIFECVLVSFNGSNYDNFLLCNSLIIIQTKLKQKIKIFKKGSSLSTMNLICKNNLTLFSNILKKSKKNFVKSKNVWLMNLFIKDIRNLVAANMSLDQIGKMFNINVSKLCFPYEHATTIKKIKKMTSLHPYNEQIWKDDFSKKTVSLENRLNAQAIFESKNFSNLYEYGNYYLKLDCLLLHCILLKLFHTYLNDSINIFIRRNYSQSNLSYQQFFIIEPSKQIKQLQAPLQSNNPFYNHFIKQAVTGGLCTSFVHGKISNDTIINEHLNYLNKIELDVKAWPNFKNLNTEQKIFNELPSGVTVFDIRSLYPSAALKKLPVGIPLFFSRFVPEDFNRIKDKSYKTLHINSFCNTVENEGDTSLDFFKLVSTPPRFYNEFNAINHYLKSLPSNITILRFQTNFTAMGQLYFVNYPVDAFLSFEHNNQIFVKIIQYNSTFYHGHKDSCKTLNNSDEIIKAEKTKQIKTDINKLCQDFTRDFHEYLLPTSFEYIEISECDFFLHKIPKISNFHLPYKSKYSYQSFLEAIYTKKLTGFIVVKDLEIKKNNQNPLFGFIIQKTEYEYKHLSPYTQQNLVKFNQSKRVISLHKNKSFMVISTEYFNWLNNTFGFEKTPNIYHALFFQLEHYLKASIESKLQLRKNLKELIKNETDVQTKKNYEIRAELIKLMLNSCYGFSLCNLTSTKFKHFENRRKIPPNTHNFSSCVQIDEQIFLIEKKRKNIEIFQTLLGQVGCSILFYSKIILMKRIYFLLKYLNPTQAQLLYMDTDSAHILLKHPRLIDNVDTDLKHSFSVLYNKHFETGTKVSGIWVTEGTFDCAEYLGEKSYRLYNKNNSDYVTHMKGLNNMFQKQFHEQNVDSKVTPYISYNIFFKSPDFVLFKTHMNKNLFSNFIPIKRYFVSATGSLPLKLNNSS